jgi:hypothetical protein
MGDVSDFIGVRGADGGFQLLQVVFQHVLESLQDSLGKVDPAKATA